MDGQERKPDTDAADKLLESIGSVGLSRRDFTKRVGAFGSVAAVGGLWAAPKISTIRYATKAKAGSPPPTSTTTTTTGPGPGGHISISDTSPCVGDTVRVRADGFAPRTAVTLEIDSAEHSLGVTTADAHGRIDVRIQLSKRGPTGKHMVKAVGVQAGGRTLSMSAPVTILTEAECAVGPKGSTTTSSTTPGNPGTTSASSTTTPTTSTPVTTGGHKPPPGGGETLGGSSLAFTGTDAIDLALIGGAAAIGGRALYGLARRRDDEDDEEGQ